jgi:hypothetical protein
MTDRQNDPRISRDLERRRKDEQRRDEDALRFVLGDPRGRRAYSLIINSVLQANKVCGLHGADLERFSGRRDAAQELVSWALRVAPRRYFEMQRELSAAQEQEAIIAGAIRAVPEEKDEEQANA